MDKIFEGEKASKYQDRKREFQQYRTALFNELYPQASELRLQFLFFG
jgi:hypothetical protein